MNSLTLKDHGNLNIKAFEQRMKMPWKIRYNYAGALLTRYLNSQLIKEELKSKTDNTKFLGVIMY